jgi:hypothetical protein
MLYENETLEKVLSGKADSEKRLDETDMNANTNFVSILGQIITNTNMMNII